MRQTRSMSATLPAVVFTGHRIKTRIRVKVDDAPLDLSRATYRVLLSLVVQLAESEAGYLKTRRNDIFRLRRELIRAVGEETAAAFIETGGHDEYRLAIRRDEWKKKIGVSRCFFDLIERGIVTEEQAKKLRRVARIVRRREY